MTETPNPRSDKAINAGCRCPVLDNHHGAGVYRGGDGPVFWINGDCPLHATEEAPDALCRAVIAAFEEADHD